MTESERCRLLAAERRRLALDELEGRTGVDLDALAADVAARETGRESPDERTVERVAVALYHVHLPMLADHGVVEFDSATGRVEPAGGSLDL